MAFPKSFLGADPLPSALNPAFIQYSEQDTADKLILPYLTSAFGFPASSSLEFQAQHTTRIDEIKSGRYDGLYLSGGFPYVLLEAKRYMHDLTEEDFSQARSYATGTHFDKSVPFLVVSNGREHQFYQRTETINPGDGKLSYNPIPGTPWHSIIEFIPGEIRRLLPEKELLSILLGFKQRTLQDISSHFLDPSTAKYDKGLNANLGHFLDQILQEREKFVGQTGSNEQASIRHALEVISLHFTSKILFIKLIEDLSAGSDTPRVIHTLFPRIEYDLIGGLFGFKVLNALSQLEEHSALKTFAKSKRFYRQLGQDIARVSWQDIFRYGFSVHSAQYGKLFKAANYDRFLPSEGTLEQIRNQLITIDIRSAILYGDPSARLNVIGRLYERLIDEELRNSIGAVYTPDPTMRFMVQLGKQFLGRFRGHKIVEPSCGSGHFYRQIYRDYVSEVIEWQTAQGQGQNAAAAHAEGLAHVYGRDVDPFAVQLTMLGTFLEQLKDNVRVERAQKSKRQHQWAANLSIDTQNSLDPITVDPDRYFDMEKTADLANARSRRDSCRRAFGPDLVIGNPPYGVAVVKGTHYNDIYDLGNSDSYGYFIVNALKRLPAGKRVLFIVSSSFLTIKSHFKLRQYILGNAKIIRVIKLSRHIFPGIDIFPVIIELERCLDKLARENNVYQFFDLWQLHPEADTELLSASYQAILNDVAASQPWPFPPTRTARYTVRQGIISRFSRLPIFEARPSLYEFMQDTFAAVPPEVELTTLDGSSKQLVRPHNLRGRQIVKLSEIADVKIGLQSGNNPKFYRAAAGVKGGASKGGYKPIDLKNVLTEEELQQLNTEQKSGGIEVDDPSTDRYFVPLDKAGVSDIEGGLLPLFYRPVEFYIDWSQAAVSEMKLLPGARFQNSQFYFKRGISFSNTGIYSPTFRLSHGGVFDQTGSCIFSDFMFAEALLGLLSSTLLKYFVKSFINHGVHAQLDDLPIVLPTSQEIDELQSHVNEIVAQQKGKTELHDYREQLDNLDSLVFDIYGLTSDEREEVSTSYKRHYPKLFNISAPEE
jgi:type I restriction-modification system DNA methylase subunit